jgi:hypothetical protein
LKVIKETGWQCHHAQEASWGGRDDDSNLIYLSLDDHSPFSAWWDRRRDDIQTHLGIAP